MKYIAIVLSGTCAAMAALTWDSPTAIAWTVAFCGWLPHCFSEPEASNGNS